jgi:uncharacterized DUF497 family protein
MTTREIEFDPEKAAINLQVHKVTFEDAALVFVDPLRIERRDDSENNTSGEERWQTLGWWIRCCLLSIRNVEIKHV